LKSRKEYSISFEESKKLIAQICEIMGIPVPSIILVDAKVYEGEYKLFEIGLREKNSFETIMHELLHYAFDLVYHEKKNIDEYDIDLDDDYEHRIIQHLEGPLGGWARKIYKSAKERNKR
jgi:hypothetical protein